MNPYEVFFIILGAALGLAGYIGGIFWIVRQIRPSVESLEKNISLECQLQLLRKENEELKSQLESKDLLLSIACHDIASPLTVIKSGVEQLHEILEKQNSSTFQIFHRLKKMHAGLKIIEGILDKLKSRHLDELKQKDAQWTYIDLEKALREVAYLLEDKLKEKNLRFEIKKNTSNPILVKADRITLQSNVFFNLLSNAIKFSHLGGTINACLEETDSAISIHIEDQGIGISKEIQSRLFGSRRLKSRPGTLGEQGTGLGLPIVKNCLAHFNASIECQSLSEDSAETGTRFIIQFPKVS